MIFVFLKKPYPFNSSLKRHLIIALLVGLFISITHQLLSIENISDFFVLSRSTISVVFGIITFFSVFLVLNSLPRIFLSTKNKENWTILKELTLIATLHLVIIIFNYTFLIGISKNFSFTLSLLFFLSLIVSTLLIGFIPSCIILWIDYTIKLKSNLKQTLIHNQRLEENLKNQYYLTDKNKIHLSSDTINDTINFELKDLLFIKSDGNYIEIYTRNNNEIIKCIHRLSIKKIEEKINIFPSIIKTHRSYLVNIHNIETSKGNARNYQLFFKGINFSIPVSRNKFKEFNTAFKNIVSIGNK